VATVSGVGTRERVTLWKSMLEDNHLDVVSTFKIPSKLNLVTQTAEVIYDDDDRLVVL
jgi:hypothetical protein